MKQPPHRTRTWTIALVLLAIVALQLCTAFAQSTAFTYQGRLNVAGSPANGVYDLTFQAFDALTNGSSLGGTVSVNAVAVTNGLFTAVVDLGAGPFTGPARWLQIGVSTNGAGSYSTLSPRQPLTPAPYAIYANTAGTVTNGGIGSAQLATSSVAAANIQNATITATKIGSGQVVKSLNGLSDAVSLTQGANVTINTVGNSLQISAPAGGLALPYAGSVSTSGTAFSISNAFNNNYALLGRDVGVFGSSLNAGVSGQYGNAGNYGLLGTSGSGAFGVHVASGNNGYLGTTAEGAKGIHGSSGNYGQLGTANGGVYGATSVIGDYGVRGDGFGNAYGVYATSDSADGVYAFNGASAGAGNAGIRGETASANAAGVRGNHTPSGNYGQLGTANEGVRGVSSLFGNYGSLGAGNYGVVGLDYSAGEYSAGVRGAHYLSGAFGLLGTTIQDPLAGPIGLGVYGSAGDPGWAGYFEGSVLVSHGSLSVSRTLPPGSPGNTTPLCTFARNGSDGPLVGFYGTNGLAGSITVSETLLGGSTVSYNGFSGSHYGWTDEEIESGALVSLTGMNRWIGTERRSEIIYGVRRTSKANDSKCLGSYVSRHQLPNQTGEESAHLITAVGNGGMWVTPGANGDLEPGDYLISSDVPGCAMKDDPERFPVGYICARAAERVKWSEVQPDALDVKRKQISVLFESFERHSGSPAPFATIGELQARLEAQEAELKSLRLLSRRLAQIVDRLGRIDSFGSIQAHAANQGPQ